MLWRGGLEVARRKSRKSGVPHLSRQRQKELRLYTAEARYREAVGLVARGKSLTASLKEVGLSRGKFIKINEGTLSKPGLYAIVRTGEPRGKPQFAVGYNTLKTWELIDRHGVLQEIRVTGKDREKLAGYQDAVRAAIRTGSPTPLRPFRNIRVRDIYGKVYRLNTDFETLRHSELTAEPRVIKDMEIYTLFGMVA
jgi:hypothetical protein